MEKTNKQLSNDIRAMRNPEQSLPELMNRLASAYGMMSLYNLNMEFSMLVESKAEGRIKPDKFGKDTEDTLRSVMLDTLLAPFSPEAFDAAITELTQLREKVTARMDILTAYADLFIVYEYCMNRLEAVFEPQEETVMDNDSVSREILQWIFSETEPAMVNTRIKHMLSCLPVRMTKAKFLELVDNAFSVYEKAEADSIDTFDYMLRSAAGMHAPKGMAKAYSKLDKVKKLFEEKSLSDLTEEEYEERKDALAGGVEYIYGATECISSLQSTLNALLTVLLTKQYFTLQAERASKAPADILRKLLTEENADSEQLFSGMELSMEALAEEITLLEPLLGYVKEGMAKKVEELMLSTVFQRLLAAQRLNSGSAYASLGEEKKETEAGYLKKVKEQFLVDIREVLENGSRVRNRAVMAEVLKELPVYFNNHTEVMNYVRNSLDSCKDEGEKRICVELLRSLYDF